MASNDIQVYKRHESAQQVGTPEYGSEYRQAAAEQNILSDIGARVAQSASQDMAVKLGYETGKNPQGDLGPAITEFDKTFAQSYHAQAYSTLSSQANKLITDADLELSKPPRLTPELIAKSNQQVKLGLDKLAEMAPTAIKGDLQRSFDSSLLVQNSNYQKKMLSQQRTDQAANIRLAQDINLKKAYEQGYAGDLKGIAATIKSSGMLSQTQIDLHLDDPGVAKATLDEIKLASKKGLYNRLAADADSQKKLPEFLKGYVDKKPPDMTTQDWVTIGQGMKQHVDFLDNLRQQSESLTMAKFQNQLISAPGSITGSELQSVMSSLSPLNAQKVQLEWNRTQVANQALNQQSAELVAGWDNPEVFARADSKSKDQGFDDKVKDRLNLAKQSGDQLSVGDAEAQVAAEAAGPIPRMINLLNAKSRSLRPQDIEAAARTIGYMNAHNKTANLEGIDKEAIAMNKSYMALTRGGVPPIEATQKAHDSIYGQNLQQKQENKQAWQENVKPQIKAFGTLKYFGQITGVNVGNLVDPQGFTEQAETLLENNFYTTNGDLETAKEMTKESINSTYGETTVNGNRQTTYLPLEQVIGLPADATQYIQQDVLEQVDNHLKPIKEAYDKGESQFYWELEPRRGAENLKSSLQVTPSVIFSKFLNEDKESTNMATQGEKASAFNKYNEGGPMIIHRVWKDGHRETYPLVVKADPWLTKANNPQKYTGSWDIVLGTKNGWKPLQMLNPMSSELIYYRPDVKKIKNCYLEATQVAP